MGSPDQWTGLAPFHAVCTPIVPLILAGVLGTIGRDAEPPHHRTAEELFAAAVFGAISSAVVLIGGI
jgi:hypothetical protein